ncbi:kinase-like protein [Crepidotus variabilis]|uniref:Kinase-like protein n=1 Tax=Crepidotus variabilis TaxID=179855 RepID=A0A9P6EI63_9AGAR|nr:kinase-like protein [Crepidotus variabilis]
MKRCRHANIVRLVEVIDDPAQEKIYLVMEYLAGGPIHWQTPEDKPVLTLKQTRRIMRDAMLGLEYLHHEGIIHRDIKPANLLYTRDRRTVKIVDFGVAHYAPTHRIKARETNDTRPDTIINQDLFPLRNLLRTQGTPIFLAPEVLDETLKTDSGDDTRQFLSYDTISAFESNPTAGPSNPLKRRPPLTTAIDVWALGVTFYCLLFGHVPFTGDNNRYALNDHILKNDFKIDDEMGYERVVTGGRHPGDNASEGSTVVYLLEKVLEKKPSQRITIATMKVNFPRF